MKVTIITPTEGREPFLRLLYGVILAQTEKDWEWRILDDSLSPSPFFTQLQDSRVHYTHTEEGLSIGEKRNRLVDAAQGEWIFHFDDDDYYAPQYIERILEKGACDFIKLSCWFAFSSVLKQYFYWETGVFKKDFFYVSSMDPSSLCKLQWNEVQEKRERRDLKKNLYGFGFSYAYRRSIFEKARFPNKSRGEDYLFYKKVEKGGYKVDLISDKEGLILHMMHDRNTAEICPHYALPAFCGEKFFPHVRTFLESYPNGW